MASALASALDATPSRAPIPAGDEQGERQVTRLASDVNTCMPGKSDSETSIHKSQRLENSKRCFFFQLASDIVKTSLTFLSCHRLERPR